MAGRALLKRKFITRKGTDSALSSVPAQCLLPQNRLFFLQVVTLFHCPYRIEFVLVGRMGVPHYHAQTGVTEQSGQGQKIARTTFEKPRREGVPE